MGSLALGCSQTPDAPCFSLHTDGHAPGGCCRVLRKFFLLLLSTKAGSCQAGGFSGMSRATDPNELKTSRFQEKQPPGSWLRYPHRSKK